MLAFAAIVLVIAAWYRGGEYDEFYSVFIVAGDPRPAWSLTSFAAGAARSFFDGHSSFGTIAFDLRQGDVHPPLYFWLLSPWRAVVGYPLIRLRLLSVICSLVSLALIGRIARRIGVSPVPAMAITLLCYGFAYTGIVARDFALAQLLCLAGAALLTDADIANRRLRAILGGVALGAASFTNDLALFTVIALLLWFASVTWRRPSLWIGAGFGAALFGPGDLWFLAGQMSSRPGQFARFQPFHAIVALARDQTGAVLGALPRYLPAVWSLACEILLTAFALLLTAQVVRSCVLAPRYRGLLVAGVLAPPVGLLVLGAFFDTMPIEMRYVWLGLPYIGIALASALSSRMMTCLLAVQAAAIIGLTFAPQTMQPAARVAREAGHIGSRSLVMVPFGNDGVGVPGPFVAAAPATMRILVVRSISPAVLAQAADYPRVVIGRIEVDQSSRSLVAKLIAVFRTSSCWQGMPAAHDIAVFANRCTSLSGR